MGHQMNQHKPLARLGLMVLSALLLTIALLAVLDNPGKLGAQARGAMHQANDTEIQQSEVHQWVTETVDIDGGWSPSIVLDQYQKPHIAYDCATGLCYAVVSGTQWMTETMNLGLVGEVSLVLDAAGRPHISSGNGSLSYAYFDGVSWAVETIEPYGGGGLGRNSALALDATGHPHITYYAPMSSWDDPGGFRHAYYDGTHWVTETVAGVGFGNGAGVSSGLLVDSQGHLHALYDGESLMYARFDGTTWITQAIAYGRSGSIAMAPDGSLHVSFFSGDTLRYASLIGSEWVVQDITSVTAHPTGLLSPMGFSYPTATALQIDRLGMPHIAFHNGFDEGSPLFYAHFNGSEWIIETIDSQGTPGYGRLSLAVDPSGYPHIAYNSSWIDDSLRYAYVERPAIVVSPTTGATLVHTDTQSLHTTVRVPSGAVTEPMDLVFTERDYAFGSPAGYAFAGQGFQLEVYHTDGMHIPNYAFKQPITVTVEYSKTDIAVVSDESTLELRYWNGSAWNTDGITVIERDRDNNRLAATITHLSQFAMFGQTHQIYLPLVLRNY